MEYHLIWVRVSRPGAVRVLEEDVLAMGSEVKLAQRLHEAALAQLFDDAPDVLQADSVP